MTVIAQEVFGARYELAERYEQILATKGIEWGLMGPRETDRLWDRHILNAVALSDLIPKGAIVGDVGSGAGLPGIPLAIKRPDLEMTLIEPLLRRYNFLRETIDELGLGDQVRVERLRAEDCDEVFDIVTCRAVAPLPKLLKWCTPLFFPDGQLVALKGSSAAAEVEEAQRQLSASGMHAEVRQIRAHADTEPTQAIVVGALH